MCGRFAITHSPEEIRAMFGYAEQPNFPPRYNVAPTQPVPIVLRDGAARHFMLVRWGFLPGWVKDPRDFPLVINARGETIAEKPAFRAAVRHRRCLVPADAFYEWRREGRQRQPYMIRRRDRGLMAFAGIWETYATPEGSEIDTMALVTTAANGTVAALHERMPVIIAPEDFERWLDTANPRLETALDLIRPAPDDLLDLVPVGQAINRATVDDPSVQEPRAVAEADEPAATRRPAAGTARKRAAPPATGGTLPLFDDWDQ